MQVTSSDILVRERSNTLITRSLTDMRAPPEDSCNELSWVRKL